MGGRVEFAYSHAVKGFSLYIPEKGYERMMQHVSGMISCEPDQLAHSAPGNGGGGNPNGGGGGNPNGGGGGGGGDPQSGPPQEVGWGVTRVTGYDNNTVANMGNPGVGKTAWVIDSGVDLDHPDLNLQGTGNITVSTPTVDVARSTCFLRRCSDPNDEYGHGTHVAGIIGAVNNDIGAVGVAAGATIVSVRVLDKRGSGPDSGVIAGIDYVAAQYDAGKANQGDVANLSLITGKLQAMNDAVEGLASKGIKVTIAAGNSNMDASLFSPASANGSNVYTVSATQNDADQRWPYSNYGNSQQAGGPIDYAEPGANIFSLNKDAGYTTKTGTSMAAPNLAGILLLGSVKSGGPIQNDVDGFPEPVGIQ